MPNTQHHLTKQELADYVVHNSEYYEKYRKQFNEEKGFKSLNLMALLLPPVWASYRRVWVLYWLPLLLQGVLIALGIVRFRPQFYGLPEYLQFIIYLTFLFVILGTIGLLLRANFFLLLKAKNSLEQNKTATSHWLIVLIASVLFYSPIITVLTPTVITFFEPKPQPIIKEVSLFIQSAVYDDKRTAQVDDDTLYIYFSKDIDPTRIKDLVNSYKIEGVGAFGSQSQAEYQQDIFRHRIKLGKDAVPFEVGKTTIALHDQFGKNNSMVIKPFNYFGRLAESSIPSDNDYIYKDFTSWLLGKKTVRGLARKYINNGDNTVTDLTTQLMWQDSPKMNKTFGFRLQEALKFCADLKAGGYDDWYLPSILELLTIDDKGYVKPSRDPSFLHTVQDERYLSSTSVYYPYMSLSLYSHIDTFGVDALSKYSESSTRCVRRLNVTKVQIEPIFIKDDSKNIIIDTSTNLMWQNEPYTLAERYAIMADNSYNKVQDISGAINYCNRLNFAGYNDWVLPTIIEFTSLRNFSKKPLITNYIFGNKSPFSDGFLTSTHQKGDVFIMSGGGYAKTKPNSVHPIHCVRIID